MKRAAIVWMLTAASLAFGQGTAQPNPPAGQPGQPGTTQQPGTAQQPGAAQQPGTAQQPGAQPGAAAPQGKRPLQAKTQPEFDAYKAAIANTDPAAMEKAADDFAAKFPDSDLRAPLYESTMRAYQNTNNADKMLEMGRKVLAIDPDDPEALVGVAEVLTERTRDSDIDKDQRLAEAKKMAEHALQTVDTDIAPPAGTPPEKLEAYKNLLRSTAYSIVGALAFNQGQFAEAETAFRKSIDVYPAQPDPIVVLRLALSLDRQSKYSDALKEANRAVELTQEGTPAGKLSRQERDRLVQLAGKPGDQIQPR